MIEKQATEDILNNHLQLKTLIDVVRWLTFSASAFGGHNENPDLNNQGNFLEMIRLLASYNEHVDAVLKNALRNAKHTLPNIQKEISHASQGMYREQYAKILKV